MTVPYVLLFLAAICFTVRAMFGLAGLVYGCSCRRHGWDPACPKHGNRP